MRIIFRDDSSTFHPQGVQEPDSPFHAAPPRSRQMWHEGGEKAALCSGLSAGPRTHKQRQQWHEAREEGGFQERPRPVFPKANAASPGEQETPGERSLRSQGGRWGTEAELPAGLALNYLAPQSAWWSANPQESHPTPQTYVQRMEDPVPAEQCGTEPGPLGAEP